MAHLRTSHDYYHILGMANTATLDVARKRYRALALEWHPDKCPGNGAATALFQLIQEAWETIENPVTRREYDEQVYPKLSSWSTNHFRAAQNARDSIRKKAEENALKEKRKAEMEKKRLAELAARQAKERERTAAEKVRQQAEAEAEKARKQAESESEAMRRKVENDAMLKRVAALKDSAAKHIQEWRWKKGFITDIGSEICKIQSVDATLAQETPRSIDILSYFTKKSVREREEKEAEYHQRRTAVRIKESRLLQAISECRKLAEQIMFTHHQVISAKIVAGAGVEVLQQADIYHRWATTVKDWNSRCASEIKARDEHEENILKSHEQRKKEEQKWLASRAKPKTAAQTAEEKEKALKDCRINPKVCLWDELVWEKNYGAGVCEMCSSQYREFVFECRVCGLFACQNCRNQGKDYWEMRWKKEHDAVIKKERAANKGRSRGKGRGGRR